MLSRKHLRAGAAGRVRKRRKVSPLGFWSRPVAGSAWKDMESAREKTSASSDQEKRGAGALAPFLAAPATAPHSASWPQLKQLIPASAATLRNGHCWRSSGSLRPRSLGLTWV